MAARAMSFEFDSTPERWHLGRKLTLLFLLVIALALGLVILFHQRINLPLLVFNLFADISIGLVVGLATRFVLHQRNWFVRGLASAALAVIGLLVSGYCTDGKIGMLLPPVGLVQVDWRVNGILIRVAAANYKQSNELGSPGLHGHCD